MSLTEDGITNILGGILLENPIVQIMNIKAVHTEGVPDKMRLIISDGVKSHSYTILSAHQSERVTSGEIVENSLVRLDKYIVKDKDNKKVIIISELTVMYPNDTENHPPPPPKVLLTKHMVAAKPPAAQLASVNIATIPINLLNPYQNKWSIKGCVTHKTAIKTWSKPSGDGKLFAFTMTDDSCDVKVTAFNQEADRFLDLIEVGKVYILSKAQVKAANKQFNSTKCDHEITLKSESEILEVFTATGELPMLKFDFVPLSELKNHTINTSVDVVGIAHDIKAVSTITGKASGKEVMKRDVTIVDRSGWSINLTLWSEDVTAVDNLDHPVIVLRGAFLKDFSGRSLNVSNSTMLRVNPTDIPEAQSLVGWYNNGGQSLKFEPQSTVGASGGKGTKRATIAELACTNEKGDYFMVSATVANVKKDNIVYKACEKCNKKMIDLHNGLYNCEHCGIESNQFKYRLMMQMTIVDFTGQTYVTAFHEVAEKILGVSADTIGDLRDTEQQEEVEKIIGRALYREEANIKMRVNNDTYNDETRLKATAMEYSACDTAELMAALLAALNL